MLTLLFSPELMIFSRASFSHCRYAIYIFADIIYCRLFISYWLYYLLAAISHY